MGTYNIPRNVKGEGRILYIFSYKALIYTAVGAIIGWVIFYNIFKAIKLNVIGVISIVICALTGFIIATLKIPEIGRFKTTQTVGGQKIDDVIIRSYKFKKRKNKIYLYAKEEKKNG